MDLTVLIGGEESALTVHRSPHGWSGVLDVPPGLRAALQDDPHAVRQVQATVKGGGALGLILSGYSAASHRASCSVLGSVAEATLEDPPANPSTASASDPDPEDLDPDA